MFKCNKFINNFFKYIKYGDWGLGIGDWGLGIGPNPQSPIPNPHEIILIYFFFLFLISNKYLKNLFKKCQRIELN